MMIHQRSHPPYPGIIVLCGTLLLASCAFDSETPNPKTLPFILKPALTFDKQAMQAADLNGDGRDEIIRTFETSSSKGFPFEPPHYAIYLETLERQTIEQINYKGHTRLPLFLDLDGDGTREMLVTVVRNDSLFLSVTDLQGRKRYSFFLIDGEPREEPEGTLPWDPGVENFYLVDTDADGQDELITSVGTGYARQPRGILIHSLPDGKLLGKKIIGAVQFRGFIDDFDGDGRKEIVYGSVATNHGARANGFDDRHSYFMVFDLSPDPEIAWSKEMGELSNTALSYEDFDGNGQQEFLALTWNTSAEPRAARFELIEPGTWRTIRQRTFTEPFLNLPQVLDLNRDARPEIVAVRSPDEIWVLDHQFDVVRRRPLALEVRWFQTCPDLDGDGIDEMVVRTPSQVALISPDLSVKAIFEAEWAFMGSWKMVDVIRRGIGEAPYLVVARGEKDIVALELVQNPYYLFYRYGPSILWVLGISFVLGIAFVVHRQRSRNALLEHVQQVVLEASNHGFLLLEPRGRVAWLNTTLRQTIELDPSGQLSIDRVTEERPALATFLKDVLALDPPRHHEGTLLLRRNGVHERIRVTAEPLRIRQGRYAHWLITFHLNGAESEHMDARTWAMMAKKVTHDIKNPLANILLTAQRLQTEYRKQAPEAADILDPFTERIIERVNHLRHMTRQFMKIIDVEAIDPVKTDLGDFIPGVAGVLARDLPDTVELILKNPSDLPPVEVDREQVQTILEHLLSNAVRALPDGGTITLATYPVLNLRTAEAAYTPGDYVVLEVQDNGVGIPEEDRARLFDPGFTTAEFGTGLGLALIQRVVRQHGGFIEVESEVGIGSIFSLYFPVAADPV